MAREKKEAIKFVTSAGSQAVGEVVVERELDSNDHIVAAIIGGYRFEGKQLGELIKFLVPWPNCSPGL